ncbi:murein transglycosylase, partial [Burkholderia diffusa]
MAVSIKNEHCMWFGPRAAGWVVAAATAALLAACGGAPTRTSALKPPTGAAIVPGQVAAKRLTPVAWQQV